MNIDKKAGHIDPKVALSQAEHEKGTVPGQQIGLYGNADKRTEGRKTGGSGRKDSES